MSDWCAKEISTVDIGDKRLDKRMKKILSQVSPSPTLSIPASSKNWAETKATYRFYDNNLVTSDKVLSPHKDATLARIRSQDKVLVIQDTTELDFTGRQLKGAGPLSYKERTGFFNHASLAVTPDRLCLGVIDATIWARDPEEHHKNDARKQKPIEKKESYRWIESYRKACAVQRQCPDTVIISVSDREGDIYEYFVDYFQKPEAGRAEWIIRGCQNRNLAEELDDSAGSEYKKLYAEVESTRILGQVEFDIPKTKHRASRPVTQTIRATSVKLKAPYRKGRKLPEVEINVVLAKEENPPVGEEPIEWLILSSLPVNNFENACEVIKFYLCRWQIEVYFKVLKSGCKIEERQLETLERIQPCIALYMIIAWRVVYVMMLGRECPDLPCTILFDDDEWQSVYAIKKRELPPKIPPSLGEFVKMVASLGGHLGRKGDKPPGPKPMWIGIQRVTDFSLAWRKFGPSSGIREGPS